MSGLTRGRIGLFGGTFDPVHWGHLLLAEAARDALGLAQVQFVLAGSPPHKRDQVVTTIDERLTMLELAVADNPGIAICRWEIEQPGPSYTVETLRHFRDSGWEEIDLLIGGDSLAQLAQWHRPDEIRALARLVVVDRPGTAPAADTEGVTALPLPMVGISSSLIRQRVRQGKTIRYWVPESVRAYIADRGLYLGTD